MPARVHVERQVEHVRPEDAFAFVLDVESYARLMPNVNRVEVPQQRDHVRISRWDTQIEGAPLIWTERDTIDHDNLTVTFETIEGDFEIFRGTWSVLPMPDGARIACDLEYSIGIPAIEEIVSPILKQKIIENLGTMLDGLANGLKER